jgi:hypothetical protein
MARFPLAFGISLIAVALLLGQDLVPKWLIFLVPGLVTGPLILGEWDSRIRIAVAAVAGATLSAGIGAASQEGGESPAGVVWLFSLLFFALAALVPVAIAFAAVARLQRQRGQ